MSAQTGFQFLNFSLRPCTEDDIELARAWTAADPAHAGIIAPAYWLQQDIGVDSYLLADEHGPLFFFQMRRAVRLLIQFAPETEVDPTRTRSGLELGVKWLSMALGACSVTELIFDSTSKLLRRFVTGKLGFYSKVDTLTKNVQPLVKPIGPIGDAVTPEDFIEVPESLLRHTSQAEGDAYVRTDSGAN